MKKVNSYNWILRIVDHNGERYELKLDYTLSNMRKLIPIDSLIAERLTSLKL